MASTRIRFIQKRTFNIIHCIKFSRNLARNLYSVSNKRCCNLRFREGFSPNLKLQSSPVLCRYLSDKNPPPHEEDSSKQEKPKLSLFQQFKQMYRDYWYVLVPVHLVTSAAWFGGFYYLAKSGVDIAGFLETLHISEKFINPLRDSSVGYIAVSYALYKIATPLRYTLTLGGTTISIKYLKELGYIKPVPSKEQLKEIYKEKKDTLLVSVKGKKEEFKQRKDQLKDRKDALVDSFESNIKKLKESTDDLKNKKLFNELENKFHQSKEGLNVRKQHLMKEMKKLKKTKD